MLRFLTAGESHGKGLVTIIDNFPAGVKIDGDFIDRKLVLRQSGYGRGARQKIETDKIEFLSGIRGGYTTGSPVSFFIKNKDYENWKERMDAYKPVPEETKIHVPRPGHADFAGSLKYGLDDIRNVLERSSARETASRVAVGAICQILLNNFGIEFASAVLSIGGAGSKNGSDFNSDAFFFDAIDLFDNEIVKNINNSELRMPYPDLEGKAKALIDKMKTEGDTVGGLIVAQVKNLPIGLGSFTQWDEKLDAHIAMSLMSIQAIKSVEIGSGVKSAFVKGSEYHDSIYYGKKGSDFTGGKGEAGSFYRKTDNAGGIEGGMSNGGVISVRCAMKPIPTLMKPYLDTVDLETGEAKKAFLERSDICAVPAASVVAEAALAFSICYFFLKKFGGDGLDEIKRNYEGYIKKK
ncbi:MAG: chorismate synthase [Candidatus Acidulodesulfobacterium ferriphilum]|uniref:Chorismate synthase n=1 Tax=Candidatus Acidulodesulfobacterium ferriphilum TaxID=2597223 RepID=A0A519B9U6_9DELT|nr:MAG: chorismate synthase [Candidatus Acidulodesulfobacterium ferriphilum]